MKDLNIFPYYDSSEEQYDKKYKQVLFVPDKVAQAREFTESQSLINRQMKENFDSLYKNGSLVDGCNLQIDKDTLKANLTSGLFYYDGRILRVDAQSLDIAASGTERLGLFVEETVITANTDETLTDPASGLKNYGLQGAHRLKIDVFIKLMVPDSTPDPLAAGQMREGTAGLTFIWELKDGVVQNYVRKPDYSLMSQVLAKRTYDESGNYMVEGLTLSTEEASVSTKIKVMVSPGICYVKGFDNTFITPRGIEVDKALTTQIHQNEPHTFAAGTTSYALFHPYVVSDAGVHEIIVRAIIRKTIDVARGTGDYDALEDLYGHSFSSIESLITISQGGTTYVQGTDYELSADTIHWLAGDRPSSGTSYTVEFRYIKNAVRGVDYSLSLPTDDVYSIEWITGADSPDDGSVFTVDYYNYKARTDLISIDKFGNIVQKRGVDVNWDVTLIPPFSDEMLPIGWVKFLPGKDYTACIVNEYLFKRTTMMELHRLKRRVDDLEENVATLALEKETQEGELSSSMIGMFVDPFTLLYKADTQHSDYYASTNLLDGELVMVSESLQVDLDRTADVRTNATVWNDKTGSGKFLTLQKTAEQPFFSNVYKTDVMNLNPHGFIKLGPATVLNPSSDEWMDTQVVERTVINNVVQNTTTNVHQLQWVANPTGERQLTKEKLTSIGEKVGSEKIAVGERLQTYARQKDIMVVGSNFEPASILTAMFGGFFVPLNAIAPYKNLISGGTDTHKVVVAADGSFKAQFRVPSGVKNGDIELIFTDEYGNKSTSVYRSRGITKIIENRTTITKMSNKTVDIYDIVTPPKQPSPTPIVAPPIINDPMPAPPRNNDPEETTKYPPITRDPLAQSFIFREDKVLVSFDVFFGTKADDNPKPMVQDDYYNTDKIKPTIPAILQIGYMKNGLPDAENIIHYQEIFPDEITASPYGETPTHISLTKPVYIPAMQDFFISLGSKSTEYTLFVSALGQEDINTGERVMKQPYQDGVLFTSSNGVTWTAEQDRDMAIVLYEGVYSASGSVQTETVSFPRDNWTGYGRVLFLNRYNEIPNTDAQYYYSTDAGVTWKPFNPGDEINTDALSTSFTVKVEMKGAESLDGDMVLTPIINVENNLIFWKYDVSRVGQYRMKSIEDVPAYNNVKIILDENTPVGTTFHKEFCCFRDSVNQEIWFRLPGDSPVDSIDLKNGYYRKTYQFLFEKLQNITVPDVTGFAVGTPVMIGGSATEVGEILYIDPVVNELYVYLSGTTTFSIGDTITDGTNSVLISDVVTFSSDPTWPTSFVGRLLMESTSFWKTPSGKNYRAIMKAI